MKLAVAEFGNATSFQIASTKVECNHGTLTTGRSVFKPLDTSDPGSFSHQVGDLQKDGKVRLKTKIRISGTDDGTGVWNGQFKRVTKVVKHGRKIDTCRLRTSRTAS